MMEEQISVSRKEKRKALKKDKRKQIRKEVAEKARAEEEARLNDPEELRKIELEEQKEKERLEKERKDFEERERIFLQELERKKKEDEEEEERRNAAEFESKRKQEGANEGSNDDDEWEYVEEGPPEIIWQGNEIIVKKNKVRVKKKNANQDIEKEDPNRPTSNPLPPQSEAYAAHKNAPITSAELLDTVAYQFPNFGTEQDKAHCPFHIKTGACRFGLRCNRVHYYPDKSTTLLIKNMYNGPGLAWEQDEGLEHTDEEVERSYEDFYEDVHTEFLKFGEIINFKVCRNGSFHLRGNVYVHYKSLDSAVMAYNSAHGRYFAGKQVKCEFVSLTRWKIAICGEYMKSTLKTCSRGSACNFLHSFSNPGGDYEWADCDKPPPRYWVKKMIALFGYSDDKQIEQPSPKDQQHSSRIFASDSYHNKRHQHNGSSSRRHHEESHVRNSRRHERQNEEKSYKNDTDSDGDQLDKGSENRPRHNNMRESKSNDRNRRTPHSSSSDEDLYTERRRQVHTKRSSRHRKVSESSNVDEESDDAKHKPNETELQSYKDSSRHHRRRSVRQNRDDEPSTKKQKRDTRKPATDTHSQHRHNTSKSRDSDRIYLLGKNDTSDRWEPDTCPNQVRRSSRETRSSSVEDESKGVGKNRHNETTREKRKRI